MTSRIMAKRPVLAALSAAPSAPPVEDINRHEDAWSVHAPPCGVHTHTYCDCCFSNNLTPPPYAPSWFNQMSPPLPMPCQSNVRLLRQCSENSGLRRRCMSEQLIGNLLEQHTKAKAPRSPKRRAAEGFFMATWPVLWPLYALYELLRDRPTCASDVKRDVVLAGWYRAVRKLAASRRKTRLRRKSEGDCPCCLLRQMSAETCLP